jgi:hypothetical protein
MVDLGRGYAPSRVRHGDQRGDGGAHTGREGPVELISPPGREAEARQDGRLICDLDHILVLLTC